jgi:hypothetical protein
MEYYVYLHINPNNGEPFYVGKGKKSRYRDTNKRSKLWKDYYKNNGFDVIFLEENLTNEESMRLERYWINRIGFNNLLNQTKGGEGSEGFKHNKETIEILRENMLNRNLTGENNPNYGGGNWSEETKKRFSELKKQQQLGSNNTFYGKTHSDEVRKIISKANKGKKLSKEHIQAISKPNLRQRKLTDKQVIEIRNKFKPYFYTKKMLAEEYNVSIPTIKRILNKKYYKEVGN